MEFTMKIKRKDLEKIIISEFSGKYKLSDFTFNMRESGLPDGTSLGSVFDSITVTAKEVEFPNSVSLGHKGDE